MAEAAPIDDELRSLTESGRVDDATALDIRRFGPEIMGLLVAMTRDEPTAADAYSLFCERVWRALPAFRFEASARTWAYVLARRSLVDVRRAGGRRPHVVGASPSSLPDVAEQARSATRSYLRTTRTLELRELRADLSEDDQLLLVLRIDRDLPWDEIARILADEPDPTPETLRRTSAALRKRFQRAKTRLTTALRAKRDDQ